METSRPTPFTKRETFFLYNSLLCLVKAIEKRYTTIDLRNELSVTGQITEVDGFMNIMLSDAALYDTDGNYRYFATLLIQARHIRYIHIPQNISIRKAIKDQVSKPSKISVKKGYSYKQSQVLKKQKETLKLVEEMKKKRAAESSTTSSDERNVAGKSFLKHEPQGS